MEDRPISEESVNVPSPEEVDAEFRSAEGAAAHAQGKLLEGAMYAGYSREALEAARPVYIRAAEMSEDLPELRPFVASGYSFVRAIRGELEEAAGQTTGVLASLYGTSGSVNALVSSAGTVTSHVVVDDKFIVPFEEPPFFRSDDEVIPRLESIDPALARTYREIGQAYHATTADPARAAIGLMRQVFDHFFGELAPDDKVRASPYWSRKKGDKPELVTRAERMTYAVHTHVKDNARAKTLLSAIQHAVDTYEILNRLHRRGTLSEKQCKRALRFMKRFIEDWTEAVAR